MSSTRLAGALLERPAEWRWGLGRGRGQIRAVALRAPGAPCGLSQPSTGEGLLAAGEPSSEALDVLRRFFRFRDYLRTTSFLSSHPELLPILLQCYFQIEEHFLLRAQPSLEVFEDPEGRGEELFVLIPTMETVGEAREALGRFDESWWAVESARAGGLLNVDLEYL